MAVTRKDRMREQEAQAFEGFYPEPNPDDPDRRFGMNIYNKMSSGEIYAPDPATGAGGDFISPGQDMYGRQDEQQLLQDSGYYDAMAAQQPPEQGFMRLNNIADLTGATIDNRNPLYRPQVQLSQDKIAAYSAMSDADKMGLDMINNGTMTGKEWYAIKKKEEKDLRDAMIEMAKENATGTTYSKDGKRVSTSADVINEFSRIGGGVSAEIDPKTTRSIQDINTKNNNITGGGGRPRIGGTSGATDEDIDKAWEKHNDQLTSYSSMAASSYEKVDKEIAEQVDSRRAALLLASKFRSIAEASGAKIAPPIATAIAERAISGRNTVFASSSESIIEDPVDGQLKLNLNGIVKISGGENVPAYTWLLKPNPQTGKFYTSDQIFEKIFESKREKFNSAIKSPLQGLFTPQR